MKTPDMAQPTPLRTRTEIKRLAGRGMTSNEIADLLNLSVYVVRKWRKKRRYIQKWAARLWAA